MLEISSQNREEIENQFMALVLHKNEVLDLLQIKPQYLYKEKNRKMLDQLIKTWRKNKIINYENICKSNNAGEVIVDVKTNLDSYLNKITNFKDWFILVRTNKEIYEMEQKLDYLNIPFTTFKRSELDLAKMRERLEENNVKLLTVHSSKGLESKNVLLYGNFPVRQKPYLINSDERKVMYVGCTRAIDKLIILN